jgi:hypothetical protein
MTKKDAITKTDSEVMPFNMSELPEHIQKSSDGIEDIDAKTDVIMPRLKIAYAQTAEHKNNGVPVGHFTTNLFGQDLGEAVRFVILRIVPGWLMFEGVGADAKLISRKFNSDVFPPIEEALVLNPENQKWRTIEKPDPRNPKQMIKVQEKPLASRVFSYIGLLDGKTPVVLTLGSSALSEAKQLNSKLMTAQAPTYAFSFIVKVTEDTDGSNVWYIPTFMPERFNTAEEIAEYKKFYDKFRTQKLNVDIDNDAVAGKDASTTEEKDDGKF